MNIVKKVEKELIKRNQEFIEKHENFNYWEIHIKYVVLEALKLAKETGANKEIVELGALLHDIALVSNIGTKQDHHINGAKIAEEILTKLKYPKDKTQKVVNCVLHHRSSKNAQNIEELCVCDADIIAHFDNIPMLFNAAIKFNKVKDANNKQDWIDYLKKDYDDLSDRTKQSFKSRFENIIEVLFPNIN